MAEDKKENPKAIQREYNAASTICNSLDTVVPAAMHHESTAFNKTLMAAVGDVDKYVAEKLVYPTVDDLCEHFGKEQIDAIATAIWQNETSGDSIIIADQTGVGKGRVAAGLIRYSILYLKKVPIFFTEKGHLISDIYRDLVDIGLDAGIPIEKRTETIVKGQEKTREEIINLIFKDIKDNEELRVDFEVSEDELAASGNKTLKAYLQNEENEAILEQVIELYEQNFLEAGGEEKKVSYKRNADYQKDVSKAIKNGRMLARPFLPNADIKVKDLDGNVLYKADKKENEKIFEDGTLPDEYKLIATAYSQVRSPYYTSGKKKGQLNEKVKLLQKYAVDGVLILDESHNASGGSNTAKTIFPMVLNSKMTTFLSATYAKRPDNMPLYALTTAIREAGLSQVDLVGAFEKGGNALQEATSAELVRNGELLRREKVISGKTEYFYEDENGEAGLNQITKLDRVAALFEIVRKFEAHVKEQVVMLNRRDALPKKTVKFAGGANRFAFLIFNFFLLGIKVKQTSRMAIESMREGKKPIIAIGNTMESAFDKLKKTFALFTGDEDGYVLGDSIPNDFKLYCAYLLKYVLRLRVETKMVNQETGETEDINVVFDITTHKGIQDANRMISKVSDGSSENFATEIVENSMAKYQEFLEEIMKIPTGIPISPIDMIIHDIKEAGFTVEEITGRKRRLAIVEEGGDIDYVIAERKVRKTTDIVREFNQNEIDCLLINQAGATGLSMHSIPNDAVTEVPEVPPTTLDNKKELKQRCMIVTQMELDINKEVQKIGRINRTGQMYPPEYYYLISAIPSEARLTAMMEKKLRSLSANVSAAQTQFSYQFTADDFFSDIAVDPCNFVLNEINARDLAGDDGKVETARDIYNLTKRLYFYNYDTQRDFYVYFSAALTKTVEELKKQGLYTGQMEQKDYAANSLKVYPFFIGNNDARTSFGRHVFIDKSQVEVFDRKNIEAFIKDDILTNFSITEKYGGKSLSYNDLAGYSAKSNEYLNFYTKTIQDVIDEERKRSSDVVTDAEKKIKELETELKKFGKLDEAIKIKEQIKEHTDRKDELAKEVQEMIMSGDPDMLTKVQDKTIEIQEVGAKITELEAKINSDEYEDVYDKREDYNRINREKKDAEYVIEREGIKSEKNIATYNEKLDVVAQIRNYIGQIGKVFTHTVYAEDYDYDDTLEKYNYNYNKVTEEKVVLIGVTWAASNMENSTYGDFRADLTLGSVSLKLAKPVGKTVVNLHKLFGEIKESQKEEGKQHSETLASTGKNYQRNWNNYLSTVDTGRTEMRYFLRGSLLKGFVNAYQNGYEGTIIKYRTDKNTVRIAIELCEEARKALEDRYNDDSAQSYPIYFDANTQNTKYFIEDYLWHAFSSKHGEGEQRTPINAYKGLLSQGNHSKIGFEVTSKSSIFCVTFGMKGIKNTWSYNNDSEKYQNMSKEDFMSELEVNFCFAGKKGGDHAEAFYGMAKKFGAELGLEDSVSAKYAEKVKEKEGFERRWDLEEYGITNTALYQDFFPTNLIDYQERASGWGTVYDFNYVVTAPYSVFKAINEYLEREKLTMVMCTSSDWYEDSDADYVFEEFVDEIQAPEIVDADGDIEFVDPVPAGVRETIDGMINNILKNLAEEIPSQN